MVNSVTVDLAVATSRFPPSFDGNPWTFGLALFGLTVISALSLAMLAAIVLDRRHRRAIDAELGNVVERPSLPKVTVLSLYQFKAACLLGTIAIGATPDVAVLLAWGEGSPATMEFLFMADRVGDALAPVPFLAFVATVALSQGAISHRLALDPFEIDIRPRWKRVKEHLRIALYAFLIAVGVTAYKAAV